MCAMLLCDALWQGEDAEQSMQLLPDSDSEASDGGGHEAEDDESEPYGGR